MSIHKKLAKIQQELHAPKGQRNNFGKYNYRSCEDILEAVKPLLGECIITISDDIREIGGRIYVESIATLSDGETAVVARGFAREPVSRKGMDDSQITGSASSYARKYALNGLLLIDDTKDADTRDNSVQSKPSIHPEGFTLQEEINSAFTLPDLMAIWQKMNANEQNTHRVEFSTRKSQIEKEA